MSNKLPLIVSLSEDATAVVGKREYHTKSNSVIGNSLPLQKSGLPNAEDSVVNSAVDIIKLTEKYPRATVAIVVMAQPLADGFPPLRICSFGSDNRFTHEDVRNRLSTIVEILKEMDIETLCYSADGDSRELKMMREALRLGTVPKGKKHLFSKKFRLFVSENLSWCIPIQDTIHEGAKLRTRLLKTHLLRERDLLLEDKMNYDAVLRLCRPELRELLSIHVPGSEATCFYLKLMHFITTSYLNKKITIQPKESTEFGMLY